MEMVHVPAGLFGCVEKYECSGWFIIIFDLADSVDRGSQIKRHC